MFCGTLPSKMGFIAPSVSAHLVMFWRDWIGLCSVLHPRQYSIGYIHTYRHTMIDTKKDIHTISTTSPHSGTATTEGRVARPDGGGAAAAVDAAVPPPPL